MRCGWCNSRNAYAEYVDNGVGMQQVAAGSCGDCGASQFNVACGAMDADPEEVRRGWWRGPDTDAFMLHFTDRGEWLTRDEWVQRIHWPFTPWDPNAHQPGARVYVRGFVDNVVHDCVSLYAIRNMDDDSQLFSARCGVIFYLGHAVHPAPTCIACVTMPSIR